MNEYVVRKKISLNATPAEVWDALTNPEKTKKYFFHCQVHSDWKPGSDIVFSGRLFLIKKIELTGKILDIIPGRLLKYELRNKGNKNKPSSTSIVTDQLEYANGMTTLSVTDDVGNGSEAPKRFSRSVKGWDKILTGLKEYLEGQ